MTTTSEQNGLGRWLKRLRAEHDLTQEMLAELIGCAVPTIRSFEVGRRRPSREMAERIAEVLKVPDQQRPEFLRLARLPIESEANAPPQPRPTATEPIEQPASVSEPAIAVSQVNAPGVLIGRQTEVHTLNHWLQHEQQRMVTIVGPGGMGKTRLAQQVAAGCGRHFRHGAAFVSLAAVTDGQNMPTTLADGLGLELKQAVDVRERVLQLLSRREQLVVLDNFEHLLTTSADTQSSALDFVQAILQRCAGVHLLVTSRERLRIGRERIFELAGLTTPKQQATEHADAVILFRERAQQVTGNFTLTADNRTAVIRICNLLDGMPLAIELAASWVRVLNCEEIADEIQRNIDFLALADRDRNLRHRSMRAVFDHSWSLLSTEEQRVLARLSVFRGGCRREAAIAVAEATLPILAALIDKSLVRRSQAGAATRYDMHELIRQYAEEQLGTDPTDASTTQQRHGEYYLGFLVTRNETLNSPQARAVKAEVTAEIDNLRLAWDWAIRHQRSDLLNQVGWTLWIFLEVRDLYREGEEIFQRAAQMAHQLRTAPGADRQAADLLWAHMVTHQAYFINRQLRPREARNLVAPAITLLRQTNTASVLQQSLFVHGVASWFHGAFAEGVADFREGVALANHLQIPYLLGFHNAFLGFLLYEVGEYELSFHYLRQGYLYHRQIGDPRSLSSTLSFLNRTALALGRSHETALDMAEALQLARAAEDSYAIILALEQSALLHQAGGELAKAEQGLNEAYNIALQTGDGWSQSRLLNARGHLALQQGELPTARQHFVDAYQLARHAELLGYVVDAVAGLAAVAASQGDRQQALTLAQFVCDHHAVRAVTRAHANHLIETMTPTVTPAEQAAISARLQNASAERIVAESLQHGAQRAIRTTSINNQ